MHYAVAANCDEVIERLRAYTPEVYEQAMKHWDSWRAYIAKGGKGSLPRDGFESYLSGWHEDAKDAAALIAELQEKLEDRAGNVQCLSEMVCEAQAEIAKLWDAVAEKDAIIEALDKHRQSQSSALDKACDAATAHANKNSEAQAEIAKLKWELTKTYGEITRLKVAVYEYESDGSSEKDGVNWRGAWLRDTAKLTDEINQLRERVKELEGRECSKSIAILERDLAISQADEKHASELAERYLASSNAAQKENEELRKALEHYSHCCHGNNGCFCTQVAWNALKAQPEEESMGAYAQTIRRLKAMET